MRQRPPTRKRRSISGWSSRPTTQNCWRANRSAGLICGRRCPGWRDMALAYYEACTRLTEQIHRGFALDLGLEEEFFTPGWTGR